MKITREKKLKYYAIGSIALGLIKILSTVFEEHLITICFPGKYKGEEFISIFFILLIIAGILIIRKSNYSKICFRIFSTGLLIDSLIRTLFFIDEFPILIILSEVIIAGIFLVISFDKDLIFLKGKGIKKKKLKGIKN